MHIALHEVQETSTGRSRAGNTSVLKDMRDSYEREVEIRFHETGGLRTRDKG